MVPDTGGAAGDTGSGGPGGSGTDFVRSSGKALFSADIRARFDIVGFDPRGVNRSSGVRCVDNLEHFLAADDTPDTPAELTTLLAGQHRRRSGTGGGHHNCWIFSRAPAGTGVGANEVGNGLGGAGEG